MDTQVDGEDGRHVYKVDVYRPSTVCVCGKSMADKVHIPKMRFIRGITRPNVVKEEK